uniref:G_PROTEIN_RECEP_F1_2 domain-containing protein n=1 Tax=Nippostrongylus brasiliensis TaxID=27835 RepID=A0A0N4YLU5_NIPBR
LFATSLSFDEFLQSKRITSKTVAASGTIPHFVSLRIRCTLPYVIYLACNWRADFLDMDPYIIMILSVGLPIQLKIKLTLTIAIAVERALALFTPFIYRRICLCTYALAFFLIAITLAAIDISIEFAVSPFKRVINCDSIGCFVGEKYLNYWGVSNMVMGMIVDCLTLLVLVKLKAMRQPRPHKNSTSKVVPKKLNQESSTVLYTFS